GGKIGNGKLIKNNINEIAPNNPMTINFINLEDLAWFDIINSPPSLLVSISNFDDGSLVTYNTSPYDKNVIGALIIKLIEICLNKQITSNIFSHPDFTVGSRLKLDQLLA